MTVTMRKYGKAPLMVRMARHLRSKSGWLLVGYAQRPKLVGDGF